MPLVVSSLMGDASDVFNWTWSITLRGTQDLSTLLQMLWEHYCSLYTFWEQRTWLRTYAREPERSQNLDRSFRIFI